MIEVLCCPSFYDGSMRCGFLCHAILESLMDLSWEHSANGASWCPSKIVAKLAILGPSRVFSGAYF